MISLKKTCLSFIAEEFEKFYFALVSSGEIQNRNFLHTVAFELLTELSDKDKLKDEYLDFLLNTRLISLKGEWFKHSSYSVQNIICRLPNLKIIDLLYICTDEVLEKIANCCPQVTAIDASLSFITDAGLQYLCKIKNGEVPCPNLSSFYIIGSNVTDEGFKYLIQNLPSLEYTDYDNIPEILYSLHKDDMYNLETLPSYNLLYLDMSRCKDLPYYNDLLKLCVTVCKKLKSLKLYILHEEQFDLLKSINLKKLTAFREKGWPKIDINDFIINKGCHMVFLIVCSCIISVNNLIACLNLRCLQMQCCILLDGMHNSQYNLNLVSCILYDMEFDYKNSKATSVLLSSSPNLEHLEFYECDLSPEMKTCILRCCENNHLKYIKFERTKIGIRFVKDILLSCPSLKTLTLEDYSNPLEEEMEELTNFIKVFPNKPHIHVNSHCIVEPVCRNADYYRSVANYY